MSKTVPLILGWALASMRKKLSNPPGANEAIVNPPQSEESKQFYLERARAKRLRKGWSK